MKNLILSIIPVLLISTKVFAVPTITTVTGVSNFVPAASGVTMAAYGGMAGTCPSSSTETCNTCTSTTTPTTACNPRNINPALVITVSFTTSVALTNAVVKLQTGLGTTADHDLNTGTTMTLAAGASGALTTTWGNLCTQVLGNAACTSTTSPKNFESNRTLIIGVDENNNGSIDSTTEVASVPIKFQYLDVTAAATNQQAYFSTNCSASTTARGACGFVVKPGDSKLYVDQFFVSGGSGGAPLNDTDSPDWLGVAFFTSGAAGITPATISNSASSPVIKEYDSSYGITDSKLDGLNNYTNYCVSMGSINKAYNIMYFTTLTPDATKMCATPSEVVGLLEDKHCFISTAAFGSDMAPEVQTFREFRNQFLLTNSFGRGFVKLYYQYGPYAADFISQSEVLRSVTRTALYPFLAFSYVSLEYGFNVALLTLMVCLILLSAISKTLFRHKKVLAVVVLLFSFNLKAADDYSGPRRVKHPGAAEGLVRIDKDGNYIYATKDDSGPKKQSGHLYFGQSNNPEVSISIDAVDTSGNATGAVNKYNFDDFYKDSSKLLIGYDYDWFPWAEKTMFGIQAGVSFMYAQGHGRLVASSATEQNPESEEKFTFVTLPLSLGAVYRFQYKDTQWVVPYASGGGEYIVLAEKREDKSTPNFTGGFGYYGAGGVLISLTSFDRETAHELSSEYGIGNLWLSLEVKAVEVESESFKFSSQFFNGGVSFDF